MIVMHNFAVPVVVVVVVYFYFSISKFDERFFCYVL